MGVSETIFATAFSCIDSAEVLAWPWPSSAVPEEETRLPSTPGSASFKETQAHLHEHPFSYFKVSGILSRLSCAKDSEGEVPV